MVHGFTKKQRDDLIETLKKVYSNVLEHKNELTQKNGKKDEY
jgi:hypothetical protein